MANEAVILVYAKAPVPGEVKTRLIPAVGAEASARLHAALTLRVLRTAVASGADVVLCGAPDARHEFFAQCARELGVSVTGQLRDADLGERMLHAFNNALVKWERVIIVGADCPALTAQHLNEAIGHLVAHDVVLTPADDGGYVLIGAKRVHEAMFDAIAWGTDAVLAQQCARLRANGLSWHELETLWDVDRPDDLARLRSLKPPLDFVWAT